MRLTNAVAAEGAINADAPYSLINRIIVEGYHRIRGANETFIDLRGPDLRHFVDEMQGWLGFDQSTTPLGIVLANTNDINFSIQIPLVPLLMPRHIAAGYLLDAPNYDQLRLRVFLGDLNNLFTTGVGSTETVGPYLGNAAFPARIRVSGYFAQAGGSMFKGYVPGRVWRYSQEVLGATMTTTANATRLFNAPKGNRIRALMLKAGVKAATTGGCDAFLTLSDVALNTIRFCRGLNKPVRQYNDFFAAHSESIYTKRFPSLPVPLVSQQGYMLMDWSPNGVLDDVLDLRGMVAGSTGDVDCYLDANVVGAAGQAAVAVYEELRGFPQNFSA
jgi:hypothetical protein